LPDPFGPMNPASAGSSFFAPLLFSFDAAAGFSPQHQKVKAPPRSLRRGPRLAMRQVRNKAGVCACERCIKMDGEDLP
jgi:hypothetical protein